MYLKACRIVKISVEVYKNALLLQIFFHLRIIFASSELFLILNIISTIIILSLLMSYPTLDKIVLDTLHLYQTKKDIPKIDFSLFQTPLVVGSGNGYHTGRILFRNSPAYFASEAEVEKKLANIPSITDVVVVSASGEKHAPIILNIAKKYKKNTFLISSSEKSLGREITDKNIIMPKIREPYTYNTSTYFGYLYSEDTSLDLRKLEGFLC